MGRDKIARGNASQFFVAGELCRRGHYAVVTLGNTPNTDILCSNQEGTKFVHIQVKTFTPGNKTCTVGVKAEKSFGENFFWVLSGIPPINSSSEFTYFIIPSSEVAHHVSKAYRMWLEDPEKNGQAHIDSSLRTIHLPPYSSRAGWNIEQYRNRWDLIDSRLHA